ncbi:MAG: substrate-binding domain-containing protein [Planctomycetota bacterium]|nr:substrate-binding domain-containing protein [Planctomycetota bacterium]
MSRLLKILRRSSGLLLALLAVGCSGGDAADSGALQIAVVPKGTAHEFWKAVHAGALTAANELDVEMRFQGPDPEGDRLAQIRLLQSLVGSGVDGIVLAPVDDQALMGPVADAKAAGVPTVVFDSGLGGDAHVAFVATDNHAGGVLAGEKLVELVGGKGKIVMLRFQQGSASTTEREAGFLEVIGRHPDIEVLSENQYAGDTEKARQKAESLLVAHPEVDAVFCPNESTTHGFLMALRAAGQAGEVKFVGFDSSAPLVDGLSEGHVHGLVLQDPVSMAAQGVRAMVAHLRGEEVVPQQTTDLVLATPENHKEARVHALLEPDLTILTR